MTEKTFVCEEAAPPSGRNDGWRNNIWTCAQNIFGPVNFWMVEAKSSGAIIAFASGILTRETHSVDHK